MTQPTLILGGGIIGLTIAYNLQQRGVSTVLLDANTILGGASSGNAGHLAAEYNYPVANLATLARLPAMLLNPLGPLRIDWRYLPRLIPFGCRMIANMTPKRYRHIHHALYNLNCHSVAAWERLAARVPLQQYVHRDGILHVASSAKTAAGLADQAAKNRALGLACEHVPQAALADYEPALAEDQQGGLYYPESAHISDLAAIGRTLADALRAAGGDIREHCPIRHISRSEDGYTLHDDAGNSYHGATLILCTGAYSKPFIQQLGVGKVALDTERGYHLMLPHEPSRLRRPLSSIDHSFVMTPMDQGLRLAGTVEYAGLSAPANMARAHNLLPLANKLLRRPLDERDAAPWMGCRPTTADSLPVIDRRDRLLLAFGHQHLGLTQAALTAELISALYHGETPAIDLSPYRLARLG